MLTKIRVLEYKEPVEISAIDTMKKNTNKKKNYKNHLRSVDHQIPKRHQFILKLH